MTHQCDHRECKHENLKYCRDCKMVYCEDCRMEFKETPIYIYDNYPVYQPWPYRPWNEITYTPGYVPQHGDASDWNHIVIGDGAAIIRC